MTRDRVFSFDVPTTAKPGDVCKINLPDGTAVEVTLPDGAVPGTAIEFSAPTPEEDFVEEEGAGSESVPDAVPCRIYWEGKPQSSGKQSTGTQGLSNAAVERIYAARLPTNHPPGEMLHVELTPGGSILAVPVPAGTTPGSDVLFKPPDDEDDAVVEVLMKGRLSKKSPKSSILKVIWQSRWFELQPSHLAYWELSKVEGAVKKGHLDLAQLVGVRAHQTDVRRFDLLLESKRLFELRTESAAERDQWTRAMEEALLRCANTERPAEVRETTESLVGAMRTEAEAAAEEAAEEAAAAEAAEEQEEEDDDDAKDSSGTELKLGMRTMSLSAKKAGAALAGNIMAAPVVVKATYMSRVQRAKVANAARRAPNALERQASRSQC